ARRRIPPTALLWLFCAVASGGAVAAVEVGAVSFALAFGLEPKWAFLFALVLCAGSVAGGVWVSVRNRMPGPWKVVAFLAATAAGSGLVLSGGHIASTLAGAAAIGLFLPLLGTFYSLALDGLAPPGRRAEVFALLRTATTLGVIAASGLLALLGLQAALAGSLALLLIALSLAAAHAALSHTAPAPPPPCGPPPPWPRRARHCPTPPPPRPRPGENSPTRRVRAQARSRDGGRRLGTGSARAGAPDGARRRLRHRTRRAPRVRAPL